MQLLMKQVPLIGVPANNSMAYYVFPNINEYVKVVLPWMTRALLLGSISLNDQQQSIPEQFSDAYIEELRKDMLRFATLQLRDPSTAEDAVQEALAAAFVSQDRFEGRAKLKSWVFSILRNKIIDIMRERTRRPTQSLTKDDGSDDELDELFDENGKWRQSDSPSDWGKPEEALNNEQFWLVFEACLNHMKENVARVFMMREFLGLETAEICAELDISESNSWVILHRARSRLRLCLEDKWINSEDASC